MAKKYQGLFEKGSLIKDKGLIQHEQVKQMLTILPALEALIPPLRDDELEQLEGNILREGCREALLVWEDGGRYILVDGHNRYRICQRHKLDFKIHLLAFESLEDAKDWMVNNQLGRRNLTSEQASYLRGLKYNMEKQHKGGFDKVKSKGQNDPLTAERLASEYGVSEKTIKRDAAFAQGIEKIGESNPALKRDILAGKVKVSKANIQQLAKSDAPIETVEDIAGVKSPAIIPARIDAEERAREIEKTKSKIQHLIGEFGQGNREIYEQLKTAVAHLGKLL